VVAATSIDGPRKDFGRHPGQRSATRRPEALGDPHMEWIIPILADLVRAYWWLVAAAVLGLGVIFSGLAAPMVIWLEDTYVSWASGTRTQ